MLEDVGWKSDYEIIKELPTLPEHPHNLVGSVLLNL